MSRRGAGEDDGEVGGPPAAPGADGHDEEQWPFFRYPREYPRSGRTAREAVARSGSPGTSSGTGRGAQPPRRDRGLSREEIVSAAIAVADAEGPEAISMRRIAREVGAARCPCTGTSRPRKNCST